VDQILTPRKIGSDDSCFFYSGGLRTLSSDEFEKVLKELFQFQISHGRRKSDIRIARSSLKF